MQGTLRGGFRPPSSLVKSPVLVKKAKGYRRQAHGLFMFRCSAVDWAVHYDILAASAQAYINALNRQEWPSKDINTDRVA